MKLTVTPRGNKTKGETKVIRREGNIPAILYSTERPCEPIIVNGVEFSTHLRALKPGHLSTTIFTLSDGKKERRVIIKIFSTTSQIIAFLISILKSYLMASS